MPEPDAAMPRNLPKILVTGAAGFIGGWMAEMLSAAGAQELRAGVRDQTNSARLAGLPLQVVACDMMRPDSLGPAMAGVSVVIHCAINHADGGSLLQGTRNVLEVAAAQGVRKVIYLSSIAVYGGALGEVTEDTPPVGPLNAYGEAKRAAEEACRQASGPGLDVAVLRPSLVYGPRGTEWTLRYVSRLRSGQLRHLGAAGEGKANLIFVGDLVRFAAQLAVATAPGFAVFNANGSEIPSFNTYFERLSQALGQGPLPAAGSPPRFKAALMRPVRQIGKAVLRHNGGLLDLVARASPGLGRRMKAIEAKARAAPNHDEIALYGRDVLYSTRRAEAFGFRAGTSLEEGIAASVAWAKASGI